MKYLLFVIVSLVFLSTITAKEFELLSPDKKTVVLIDNTNGISINVNSGNINLFSVKNIGLYIQGGKFSTDIIDSKIISADKIIYPEIREKYSEIRDVYNEMQLELKNGYSLIVRAYNTGVAYRFHTSIDDSIIITKEDFQLHFQQGDSIYVQKAKTFNSSYETPYEYSSVEEVSAEGYCCLPALVSKNNGMKILIAESNLVDYPGLWLKATESSVFQSANAGYPIAYKRDGNAYVQGQVGQHADYIAKTQGTRNFPWRIFVLAENDADLLTNTLVYQMAPQNKVEDVSWIKPGVVAFDWWGRRNIYGTDFKSGINTETAKYFIKFCADFGFEYFLFDDGWTNQDDFLAIYPELDMEEVMEYANQNGIKIMVWAIWNSFMKQEKEAWDMLEQLGISGIKFDFMNRDDQDMVRFYHHVAEEAAKRKMIIDFHGAYKPAGLRRAYPNVITREALIEFEYNGWTDHDTPEHHNLLPYIRMVTGPMDYIPYTTHNAQKTNFCTRGDMPMGMGTRAHSMALFVVLESPLQMLPDSPSDYYHEKECTEFISKIPTEWDDLKVLNSKIGDHTVLARKNGDDWYVGAITNWDKKSFKIHFDFLEEGQYLIEYVQDGINADTRAIDYKLNSKTVSANDSMEISLAPGGGWLARIIKMD